MRPDRHKRNLAQQTWYAAAEEHSRLFQLTIDVHALTPSWWIEGHQRCKIIPKANGKGNTFRLFDTAYGECEH